MIKSTIHWIFMSLFLLSCSHNESKKEEAKSKTKDSTETSLNTKISLTNSYTKIDSSSNILNSFLLSPLKDSDTLCRYFYDMKQRKILHKSGFGYFVMLNYDTEFDKTGIVNLQVYSPEFYPYQTSVNVSQTIDTVIHEDIDAFMKKNKEKYFTVNSKEGNKKLARLVYTDFLDSQGFKKQFKLNISTEDNNAFFIDIFVVNNQDSVVFSTGDIFELPLKNKDLKVFNGTTRFFFPESLL